MEKIDNSRMNIIEFSSGLRRIALFDRLEASINLRLKLLDALPETIDEYIGITREVLREKIAKR